MKSHNILFPRQGEVRVDLQDVRVGNVLCKALVSLVSIGTENTLLARHLRYSMVAVVVEVGAGVTKVKVNDRITTWAPHAQYFVAPEEEVFPVPAEIEDEDAMWATLARTTQLGVRRAELKMGESVCVVGLGILGQLVTQYLTLSGTRHIIAIDTSEARLSLAAQNGATHTICKPVDEAIPDVKTITDGKMVSVVFDITGFPTVLAAASKLLRRLGRLILLGESPTPSKQSLGPRIVGNSLSILGIHGFMFPETESPFNEWTAENLTSLFFEYVKRKEMNVKSLVTHRGSPLEAEEVYNTLAKQGDGVLGIALQWSALSDGHSAS